MSRLDRIDAKYAAQIQQAANRFGDHEDMSRGRVLGWMSQFANAHLQLAAKILENIRYYNVTNIRGMTRQLVQAVRDQFHNVDFKRIVFVPVGPPGSSSNIVVRALRDIQRPRPKVASMTELEQLGPNAVSVIVFIDDFSGTGDQLAEWWDNVEPLIRPKGATLVVALLVVNSPARNKIETFASHLLCVDELDDGADVLSDHNRVFQPAEKHLLLGYCQKTGCEPRFVRGYGSCGLLVAFRHGCPNNSLPILWHGSQRWTALFRRHAI